MLATTQVTETSGIAVSYPASGVVPSPVGPSGNSSFLAALDHRSIFIRVDRDDAIVTQEDPAAYCYLVVSGCVRTVRLMMDGRRHVGEFLFAGDLFGVDALDRHDFGAEAVTPVELRRYTRLDLDQLVEQDRDVARRLRELASSRLRSGREHMVLLGRKTAAERIASFLLEMAGRAGLDGRATIELPMNRCDMGDYLGLTIETVCRRLTRLRLDGTIAIDGAKVVIRDRRALGAAGCERVVH